MVTRVRRQEVIAALLRESAVGSQDQLAELLIARGIRVTQATLSRDLRELGAIKTPSGYELPGGGQTTAVSMVGMLSAFVTDIEQGGQMVVLKTGPGRAQLVAVELDTQTPDGVMGTIAGDDTIFLACRDAEAAELVMQELASLIGLETSVAGASS